MTPDEQLELWVQGKSVHNDELEECCPDFSCCGGDLADEDVRKRFAKAYHDHDEGTVMNMLMMFLGAMLKKQGSDEKVYVAGDEPSMEQMRLDVSGIKVN
jgi:hypothetical protein